MWIITGANGFIGSVLTNQLVKNGRSVLPVDSSRHLPYHKNIWPPESIHLDWTVKQRVQGIIHLGAISSTMCKDQHELIKNNVLFTSELFKLATEKNIPFVFVSSASVTGNNGYPKTMYAISKKFSEDMINMSPNKPDRCYIVRPFNVYGPNESHKGSQTSLAFKAYEAFSNGKPVHLFKVEAERDFVYVKDIANWLEFLIDNDVKPGTYDFGSGVSRTFEDVTGTVANVMDVIHWIRRMEMPEELKYSYQLKTQANLEWYRETGLLPQWGLEEGIEDYITNYLTKGKTL